MSRKVELVTILLLTVVVVVPAVMKGNIGLIFFPLFSGAIVLFRNIKTIPGQLRGAISCSLIGMAALLTGVFAGIDQPLGTNGFLNMLIGGVIPMGLYAVNDLRRYLRGRGRWGMRKSADQ